MTTWPDGTTTRPWTGWVRFLQPLDVDEEEAFRVCRTVGAVADRLRLAEVPEVVMFEVVAPDAPRAVDAGPQEMWGLTRVTDPRQVFVLSGLPRFHLERVAAHETRHVWQLRGGMPATATREQREHDARRFERAWISRDVAR